MVEGLGTAPELAKAAFSLTSDQPFAGPYEVAGSYVIARLKERKQPDAAEFEKKKAELTQQAAMVRAEEVLAEWTQRRCVEAKEAKQDPREHRTSSATTTPPEGRVAYEPCTPPFRF